MAISFQHIDPRSLLEAIGNDRATFAHLIGMFLRSTPQTRDALLAAAAADERATARRLAHEMRGNVVIFGATRLAAELSSLEHALDDGAAPAAQIARCQDLIEGVLAEMQAALLENGT
ncbi:Hpt domain-containing protein [Massilia sp. DWR3-1-1]|uniref:Hpt domain-containing protein n=1 Tax=Massilia sp. DWR3-1-1 TaxID=2804559 RepID=UPI003CEA4532